MECPPPLFFSICGHIRIMVNPKRKASEAVGALVGAWSHYPSAGCLIHFLFSLLTTTFKPTPKVKSSLFVFGACWFRGMGALWDVTVWPLSCQPSFGWAVSFLVAPPSRTRSDGFPQGSLGFRPWPVTDRLPCLYLLVLAWVLVLIRLSLASSGPACWVVAVKLLPLEGKILRQSQGTQRAFCFESSKVVPASAHRVPWKDPTSLSCSSWMAQLLSFSCIEVLHRINGGREA